MNVNERRLAEYEKTIRKLRQIAGDKDMPRQIKLRNFRREFELLDEKLAELETVEKVLNVTSADLF